MFQFKVFSKYFPTNILIRSFISGLLCLRRPKKGRVVEPRINVKRRAREALKDQSQFRFQQFAILAFAQQTEFKIGIVDRFLNYICIRSSICIGIHCSIINWYLHQSVNAHFEKQIGRNCYLFLQFLFALLYTFAKTFSTFQYIYSTALPLRFQYWDIFTVNGLQGDYRTVYR